VKIYGRNSVIEWLKINPQSIAKIAVEEAVDIPKDIIGVCKQQRIPIQRLSSRQFGKITRNIRTQGIIAEIGEFRYADFESIISSPKEKLPILLFLDNLNDPQNLGGILRASGCLGGFAVILPSRDSVEVTEAALRVASGGENYVPVAQVNNLSAAIDLSKRKGYWIAGAVVEGGQDLTAAKFSFPLGLVIGSEAKGIRQGLLRRLDFKFTIPVGQARLTEVGQARLNDTVGQVKLSFNVASAAAIFCYEVVRQRNRA
jgi:23S rRNA (guanosine2251-2'-O)-methyltransferase